MRIISLALIAITFQCLPVSASENPTFETPSCIKICRAEKSGKMSRGCARECVANTKTCESKGGEYLFKKGRFSCFQQAEQQVAAKK